MLGTPRTTRQPRSPTRPPATARPVPASRRGNTSTFPNQSELSPTPTVVRVEPQQHQRRVLKAAQLSRPAVCASAIASWGGPPCRGRTSRLDEPPDPQGHAAAATCRGGVLGLASRAPSPSRDGIGGSPYGMPCRLTVLRVQFSVREKKGGK